jgi:steroid delta-isomerase-like uncharacterized protein
MASKRKVNARPVVAALALLTGVAVAVGRLRWKRRGEGRTAMTEANKIVSQRVVEEIFNQGRYEVIGELVADDYVGYDPAQPELTNGPDGARRQAEGYRAAFPDLRLTIEDQIAEADKVVTRWNGRGTHEGELFGLAATGKQTTVTGITIDRIADGRIVESWTNWDTLGLLQQLGAVAQPATSARA